MKGEGEEDNWAARLAVIEGKFKKAAIINNKATGKMMERARREIVRKMEVGLVEPGVVFQALHEQPVKFLQAQAMQCRERQYAKCKQEDFVTILNMGSILRGEAFLHEMNVTRDALVPDETGEEEHAGEEDAGDEEGGSTLDSRVLDGVFYRLAVVWDFLLEEATQHKKDNEQNEIALAQEAERKYYPGAPGAPGSR